MSTRRLTVAVLTTLALFLVACGGPAASPSQHAKGTGTTGSAAGKAPAKALQPVKFLLDYTVQGDHAPFFLGVKKGFYKDAGLNVTIVPGKGSATTTEQVGSGSYKIGFAAAETAALAITKGVPVTVVADILQKSPASLVTLTKSHITKPAELAGKKIGIHPGSSTASLIPALLTANHLTNHVSLVGMNSSGLYPALATGKVDAIATFGFQAIPQLAKEHVSTRAMLYADYGVPGLGAGIIVNNSFLGSHPQIVKSFVAATVRSWLYSAKHTAEAGKDELAAAPTAPSTAAQQLKLCLKLLHTANTQGKPIGWMSSKDWQQTLAILHKYHGMKGQKPLSDYYTNKFVQ